MSRLFTGFAVVLVVAGFGLATTAQRADAAVTVGIGEQSSDVFTDPLFTNQLKLRYARNFTAWPYGALHSTRSGSDDVSSMASKLSTSEATRRSELPLPGPQEVRRPGQTVRIGPECSLNL